MHIVHHLPRKSNAAPRPGFRPPPAGIALHRIFPALSLPRPQRFYNFSTGGAGSPVRVRIGPRCAGADRRTPRKPARIRNRPGEKAVSASPAGRSSLLSVFFGSPDGPRPGAGCRKIQNRRCRRTCADDGDTDREILRQIVCEEHSDECAICRKILSKGFPKGETDALGNCRARLLPLLQRVEFLDTLHILYPIFPRRTRPGRQVGVKVLGKPPRPAGLPGTRRRGTPRVPRLRKCAAGVFYLCFSSSRRSSRSQTPSMYWMPSARSYLP